MKNRIKIFPVFLLLLAFHVNSAEANENRSITNRALLLDGNDNDVRIGMEPIDSNWTIEMWIKRDGGWTYPNEVLIGCGEYGDLDGYDEYPLMLVSGKLCNDYTGISSPNALDANWHHVAASCDGSITRLYIDGQEVASANKVTSIVPGNIGSNTEQSHTFKGLIDEVRIWNRVISSSDLKSWMKRPVTRKHPSIDNLKGYYPFDNGMVEMSPNLVGVAPYPNHAIFTKVSAKSNSEQKLPYLVNSDNSQFIMNSGDMEFISATANSCEWDFDRGSKNEAAHSLVVSVSGENNALTLDGITLDMSGLENLNDIETIKLFYLGGAPKSDNPIEILSTTPSQELKLNSSYELVEGANYFLITYDINNNAKAGNKLDAKIKEITVSGENIKPLQNDTLAVAPHITDNSTTNINTLKVMSWNIWHGGKHLGDLGWGKKNHGKEAVIDIIKRSKADIIFMQEAYGTQNMIRDSLGFYLHTPDDGSNLALFSRYPIETISSGYSSFNSIGGTIELPNGEKIGILDVWLKYAYRPEYTTWYMNDGYDPQGWIEEDKILNLEDITSIFNSDLSQIPNAIPTIIGGDYNSCSHLDWTERAKAIHNGYGPVAFPTSQFMLNNGFIDTYRTVHPDELLFPGGTWAASFGTTDSRIDFIYSRSEDLTPVASKVIRTSNTLNYPWPGDHSAVLTTFHVGEEKVPVAHSQMIRKVLPTVSHVNRTGLSLIIPSNGEYKISVLSLNGRQLYSSKKSLNAGSVRIPLNLSMGIKLITIEGEACNVAVKSIVK